MIHVSGMAKRVVKIKAMIVTSFYLDGFQTSLVTDYDQAFVPSIEIIVQHIAPQGS